LRDTKTRQADVLEALERQKDLWLATADRQGRPHLIAVSAWWDGKRLIVTTTASSRTARNLAANPAARVAIGAPDDVIVLDVRAVNSAAVSDSAELAEGFTAAVGWDPREMGEGWMFFELEPKRIQAYRGYDELEGRDVMYGGRWLA
jgi:predicted pyridoxine 5'-phosphate oxidase superfamily flavin-nucleotide-binding protein